MMRPHARGAYDLLGATRQIVADVCRGAAMQLPVVVAVISELMTVERHAADEFRPTLGVASEHEERCMDSFTPKHIEDDGRRARVRPVVERDADGVLTCGQVREDGAEDGAVTVPGPVGREASRGHPSGHRANHMRTATRPMTA